MRTLLSQSSRILVIVPRLHPNIEDLLNILTSYSDIIIATEFSGGIDAIQPAHSKLITLRSSRNPLIKYFKVISIIYLFNTVRKLSPSSIVYRDISWNNTYHATLAWVVIFLTSLISGIQFIYYYQTPRGRGEGLITSIKLIIINLVGFVSRGNKSYAFTPCISYPQSSPTRLSSTSMYLPFTAKPSGFLNIVKHKHFDSNQTISFLYIGKLWNPNKQLPIALQIIREISNYRSVKLSIVGEAGQNNIKSTKAWHDYQEFVTNNPQLFRSIDFVGELNRVRIKELFLKSDFLLFLSKHEQAGYSHIEAMSFGAIPLVLNDKSPFNQHVNFIKNGYTGYVVEESNLKAAVDWLLLVTSSPKTRLSIIRRSLACLSYNRIVTRKIIASCLNLS